MEIRELKKKANEIRKLIVQMLEKAGSGHPGGSLSATDIVTCLFFKVMRHDPKNPSWPERDRFHLSKGHCCPLWYAALAECGYFSKDELWKLRKVGACLQGHPDVCIPGINVASGSLGQGLSVSLGMALAGRIDKRDYRVYCVLGDGEIQEGNIWEAAMAAAHFKCDSLCAILDYNGYQIDGKVQDVMAIEAAGQSGDGARDREHGDAGPGHGHAGHAGRAWVAAHEVDASTERGPVLDHEAHQDDQPEQDGQHRHAQQDAPDDEPQHGRASRS